MSDRYDVIVVGGGNAGMCAALSAQEHGARVLVLEKAPEAWRGGNGFFTAGGFRFAFKSFEELCEIVSDLSDEEKAVMEVDPYTEDNFYDDLMRVTEDQADPDMAMLVVSRSQDTVRWMRDRGIRWIPMFGRQAYKVGDKFRFWGGLVLEAVGGGAGLIDMHYASAAKAGIDVRFEAKATRLVTDERGAVTGVVVRSPAGTETIESKARGPGRGRLRGQCRDAHAVSRPGLGAGARARNALQHRRRHPHGARHRRAALGALERLPRRAVGPERAVARRPEGRRQLPEALVSRSGSW